MNEHLRTGTSYIGALVATSLLGGALWLMLQILKCIWRS